MQGGPCALCQDLEEFDRGYQAILESLAEQRRNILQKINERHDPFIQRLPLELASRVLAFCLPRQIFDQKSIDISLLWDHSKGLNIKPFNIVLGSICRSWRRIAWSTPDLWSILPIRLHNLEQTQVDLTLEWLSRSAQTPLDVAVWYGSRATVSEGVTEANIDLWKPLIDIVNGCSSRWRTFVVDAPELMHSYIVGNGEATSILECLQVGPPYPNQRVSTGFSLTNALPMPSKLVLNTVPLRLIDIGWSNLTTVRVKGIFLDESLVLLQLTPRLITFQISWPLTGRDESLPAPSPTIHHTLQCFDILELAEMQMAHQLLDFLTLPSLLDLSYASDLNSVENVSAFLQRSGCRLTTLHIEAIDDPDHLSELALAYDLQTLENLVFHGFHESFLRFLNEPPDEQDGSIFLPNLHRIEIRDVQKVEKTWSALADLFLSHSPKALSIHFEILPINPKKKTSWVDKETALRFQDLVQKGHDIRIIGRIRGEKEERDLLQWFVEDRTL